MDQRQRIELVHLQRSLPRLLLDAMPDKHRSSGHCSHGADDRQTSAGHKRVRSYLRRLISSFDEVQDLRNTRFSEPSLFREDSQDPGPVQGQSALLEVEEIADDVLSVVRLRPESLLYPSKDNVRIRWSIWREYRAEVRPVRRSRLPGSSEQPNQTALLAINLPQTVIPCLNTWAIRFRHLSQDL